MIEVIEVEGGPAPWTQEEIAYLEKYVQQGLLWNGISQVLQHHSHLTRRSSEAYRSKFRDLCNQRQKEIIMTKLIRLHGQHGNNWAVINVEFPKRLRPYLREVLSRYFRAAVKRANRVISHQGEEQEIDKTLHWAILGRGGNERLRKRNHETEKIYRQIQICIHRVIRAQDNPPKLRFESYQLQKQVSMLRKNQEPKSTVAVQSQQLTVSKPIRTEEAIIKPSYPPSLTILEMTKNSIELLFATLVNLVESFCYHYPTLAKEMDKIRAICSEMLPNYDPNQTYVQPQVPQDADKQPEKKQILQHINADRYSEHLEELQCFEDDLE